MKKLGSVEKTKKAKIHLVGIYKNFRGDDDGNHDMLTDMVQSIKKAAVDTVLCSIW